MTYSVLAKEIQSGKIAPVYFLYGEEPFFIDNLSKLLEEKVLEGAERSFNFDVLMGPEITANQLITAARSYPTFAQRRLIIVKEAHNLGKAHLDKIGAYIEQPLASTVVVFLYKKKSPDKRTRFGKAALTHAAAFESKKLYDHAVLKFVEEEVTRQDYHITPDAALLLKEALGNNLSLIHNELQKMYIHLKANGARDIDKNLIYEFVNIDREFNVFELVNHLGARDAASAHKVAHYLTLGGKGQSVTGMLVQIFNYFNALALLKQQKLESDKAIAEALNINPFFAKNYKSGIKNYSLRRIRHNMASILEADMQLKGVHNTRMNEAHILKTLIYQIVQESR
ncbi:MAG: DNA polymerase III subunit delta [Bacteroidetes bacterium]|nr:DNA polymerase III subunit delta [Bacteroidota bacterium]